MYNVCCVFIEGFYKSKSIAYENYFNCLHHCSMAVKRHHDQGNSYRVKRLIRELTRAFRGLVPGHYGREHGSPKAGMTLEQYIP